MTKKTEPPDPRPLNPRVPQHMACRGCHGLGVVYLPRDGQKTKVSTCVVCRGDGTSVTTRKPRPRILVIRDAPPSWPDYEKRDTERILHAFAHAGYEISREHAHAAWKQYSADTCASWLGVPNDDAMILALLRDGTEPDDLTLNGRDAGPFLIPEDPSDPCVHGTHTGDCPFCKPRRGL